MNEPPENPFTADRLRPGFVPYRFTDEEDIERLVGRLRAARWRAEIVGPHGSGKSTLLRALEPALQQAGREVRSWTLGGGERSLPRSLHQRLTPATLFVIDGWEQLAAVRRWWLYGKVRLCDAGLLVTAHRSMGLPRLATLRPNVEIAQHVVEQLQEPYHLKLVTREDVVRTFGEHNGNIREMLFALYDLYEVRSGR